MEWVSYTRATVHAQEGIIACNKPPFTVVILWIPLHTRSSVDWAQDFFLHVPLGHDGRGLDNSTTPLGIYICAALCGLVANV